MGEDVNKIAKEILTTLENNGFQAYLVGGYVRDYLMGKESNDLDICTNASSKQVAFLFHGKEGKYYSVHLKKGGFWIDITTFRKDGMYVKGKPVNVEKTPYLEEDIKRRDFTINTICMDKQGKVIDFLGGIEDIKRKIIRVVGDVKQKLEEDPLRILRAIRFATVLDFSLEKELAHEIQKRKKQLENVSGYHLKEELTKILHSPNYKKGLKLIKAMSLEESLGIYYKDVVYTKDVLGMWAQIKFTKTLPFTKREKRTIVKVREIVKRKNITNEILYFYGLSASVLAGDILGVKRSLILKQYTSLPIFKQSDLTLSFLEIINILQIKVPKKGREIENALILEVLHFRIENKKEVLLHYLLSNRKKWFV